MSEGRYLRDELTAYVKSDAYPFHMPGHKRQPEALNPYKLDITEIAGFDNLHHANGILQEEQDRAARLYGADQGFYLVNGSTCGILAAVSASVPRGGHVLVARNCHKSVYHALQLREAVVTYVYPEMTRVGICGQISARGVEDALQPYRGGASAGQEVPFCAVIVTSPTYDGVVSDIAQIAQLVHRYGIPLIVDAAHGAHFGFAPGFPENPLRLGADACVVSAHKTLPAFTQTALLLLQGERIPADRVAEYLDIYETSSPSYLLMSGISDSIRFMEEQGQERLVALAERLTVFYGKMAALQHLHVLKKEDLSAEEAFDFDASKILILTDRAGISGVELSNRLRIQYGLELEMACGTYALALTTMMDTEEGFRRLEDALWETDADPEIHSNGMDGKGCSGADRGGYVFHHPKQVMPVAAAAECEGTDVPIREAEGAVSRSMVVPYPPGIPAVVPGEQIDETILAEIVRCLALGIEVEGLTEDQRIKIVKF